MIKSFLSILIVFFFIGCDVSVKEDNSSFNLIVEQQNLNYGVYDFCVKPKNLHSQSVVKYKIAEGEKDINWFQCQGIDLQPCDNSVKFKLTTAGKYSIYVLLTDGSEYIKTIEIEESFELIDDYIRCLLLKSDEIVLENDLEINVESTKVSDIKQFYLIRGDKNIIDVENNISSNDIIASNCPYTYKCSKNEFLTLYLQLQNGDEYVKVLLISNIDEILPIIDLSYSPKEENSSYVKIQTKISTGNGIKKLLYAKGKKDTDYFDSNGFNLEEDNSFCVTENDWYSIYAEDNYGLSSIAYIQIKNIVYSKPSIKIESSNEYYTNQNVILTMEVDYKNKSKKIEKYTDSLKDSDWFKENGNEYIDCLTITKNGIYTFYAENTEGVYSTCVYEVKNIDKEFPLIKEIKYSTLETTKELKLNLDISDNVGVYDVILAEGNCSEKNILSGFYIEAHKENSEYVVTIDENGTYTLGVKDIAGNWTLRAISIKNIDNEAPNKVNNLTATYESGIIKLKWDNVDSSVSQIKIQWCQDIVEYSDKQEILLLNKETGYSINLKEDIKVCLIFITTLDSVGNESIGVSRTVEW